MIATIESDVTTAVTMIVNKDGKLDFASCEVVRPTRPLVGPHSLCVPYLRFGDNTGNVGYRKRGSINNR